MLVSYLLPAKIELLQAQEYYDHQQPGLGRDFLLEIEAAVQRIIQHPQAWRKLTPEIRGCPIERFPYRIIYHSNPDELLIHLHRQPNSWKTNL